MRFRILPLLALCGLAVATAACARRNCVPEPIAANRHLIDLSADPDAHAPVTKGVTREVEAEFRRRSFNLHPGARPYNFLALSGGGLYGSFGVGVLTGWTESGTRPPFDVVTGISTGALIATFAFLGPEYDGLMRENILGVQRGDILRRRSVLRLPYSDAVFTSRPLRNRIAEVITPQLLCEVAKAHAAGRRLYVGTTNIDTRRLVIWDMGAIAARGTPEAVELYRDVVLASASIPGAFPPVRITVEVDGKQYEELHVDGGTSDEVIFRAFMVGDLNRMNGLPGAQAPGGSALYIVSNGKLYADPSCVRPLLTGMLPAAFQSVLYGKTRDELYRIYLNCMETGVEFRLTGVPQGFRVSRTGGLTLSAEDQNKIFEAGRGFGSHPGVGDGWRDVPPGTDATEQVMPRTGTRFATPPGDGTGAPCGPR